MWTAPCVGTAAAALRMTSRQHSICCRAHTQSEGNAQITFRQRSQCFKAPAQSARTDITCGLLNMATNTEGQAHPWHFVSAASASKHHTEYKRASCVSAVCVTCAYTSHVWTSHIGGHRCVHACPACVDLPFVCHRVGCEGYRGRGAEGLLEHPALLEHLYERTHTEQYTNE